MGHIIHVGRERTRENDNNDDNDGSERSIDEIERYLLHIFCSCVKERKGIIKSLDSIGRKDGLYQKQPMRWLSLIESW